MNCAACHARQTESFNASVHGLALKAGHDDAATCQDCHDSHEMVSADSPTSPIYFSRQAETCGACHDKEARDWAQSVHGKAVAGRLARRADLHRLPRRAQNPVAQEQFAP